MRRTAVLLSALFGSLAFSQETLIKVRVEEEGGKEAILPVEVKRITPKTETTVKEEELKVRSDAYGAELELGIVPVRRVSIYASFSYNEAKFKDEKFYDGTTPYNIKDKLEVDYKLRR